MSNRIILASLVIVAALAFNSTSSVAGPLDDHRRGLMQQCNQENAGRDREARRDRRQCRRQVRRTIRGMRNNLRAAYRECRRSRTPRAECRAQRQDQLASLIGGGVEADL